MYPSGVSLRTHSSNFTYGRLIFHPSSPVCHAFSTPNVYFVVNWPFTRLTSPLKSTQQQQPRCPPVSKLCTESRCSTYPNPHQPNPFKINPKPRTLIPHHRSYCASLNINKKENTSPLLSNTIRNNNSLLFQDKTIANDATKSQRAPSRPLQRRLC